MIIQHHKLKSISANLSSSDVENIKNFVQGAFYCFCKNCPNEYFAAKDLFGGENYFWQGTPLIKLYNYHAHKRINDAGKMAGKDIGWILLDVLHYDKREFELRKGYVNEYRWTGKEKNN